jgi:hypothetical protein
MLILQRYAIFTHGKSRHKRICYFREYTAYPIIPGARRGRLKVHSGACRRWPPEACQGASCHHELPDAHPAPATRHPPPAPRPPPPAPAHAPPPGLGLGPPASSSASTRNEGVEVKLLHKGLVTCFRAREYSCKLSNSMLRRAESPLMRPSIENPRTVCSQLEGMLAYLWTDAGALAAELWQRAAGSCTLLKTSSEGQNYPPFRGPYHFSSIGE